MDWIHNTFSSSAVTSFSFTKVKNRIIILKLPWQYSVQDKDKDIIAPPRIYQEYVRHRSILDIRHFSKYFGEFSQIKMFYLNFYKTNTYYRNFELIIWAIMAYKSYFYVMLSSSIMFFVFLSSGLNILFERIHYIF